ncbi:hypothetical protein IMPERIA89_290048 [Imperialibacter sp. 89]|nr:hypothetical protein IMPERIA75_200047 [Imperialibacter sp. 75]CAD5262368.1 hypothetical protein IMPERIA89_290048 [Imperialibacter sp. 89]
MLETIKQFALGNEYQTLALYLRPASLKKKPLPRSKGFLISSIAAPVF